MKKVSILLMKDCTPIAPVGAMELLRKAGIIHQQLTGSNKPFFEVEIVGVEEDSFHIEGGLTITTKRTIDKIEETDILLIPAIEFDVTEKLEANKSAIPQIKRLHQSGADTGSMCTGAFMLAEAGILHNKPATTHWYMATTFKKMYPDVKLKSDKLIIDNGSTYTCGGATSFINLVLYMVEKYCGKETAIMTSKMLLIDYGKQLQNHYAIFIPQLQHNDEEILKVQEYLHSSMDLKSISELAEWSNMSLSTFQRRFKSATGEMPQQYLQKVLVEKAKDCLEKTGTSFEQISYDIGYTDVASFRKIFKKHTGFAPQQYRKKYSM